MIVQFKTKAMLLLGLSWLVLSLTGCNGLFEISQINVKVKDSSIADSPQPEPLPEVPLLPPSGLNYPSAQMTLYKDDPIGPQAPTVTGTVTTYSIVPALPTGLVLNSTTGVISGVPTVNTPAATYTLSASNASGTTTTTMDISVGPDFTINSVADAGDSNVGDAFCDNGAGACTLRAAIQQINSIGIPAKINLATATYTLGGTEIPITTTMTISGTGLANSIISGNNLSRIFNISAGTLTLNDLSIQNGNAVGASNPGGAIFCSSVSSSMLIDNVEFKNNTTPTDTNGGGALYFSCNSLDIRNSIFSNNSSINAGGVGLGGGAIHLGTALGSIRIYRTAFNNNSATFYGGAILSHSYDLVITESSFSSNSIGFGQGGAINSDHGLKIYRSTFESNVAADSSNISRGGAVYIDNIDDTIFENNTFYGNSARRGGAIFANFISAFSPSFSLKNLTIVANTASVAGGGIFCQSCNGGFLIQNSVLTGNAGGNCGKNTGTIISSLGYNLDSANTCSFAGTGDVINTDPLVVAGAPASNGGPTKTIALQNMSPAIDTGSPTSCLTTDQRGQYRPTNGTCDKGAYEY